MLDHLSDEALHIMEGNARGAIIARLTALHEIQNQLTGIVTQLTQVLVMIPDTPVADQSNHSSDI